MKNDGEAILFVLWIVAGLLVWFNITVYAARALGLM